MNHEALRDAVDEIRRSSDVVGGRRQELRDDGVEIATQRGSHAFGPEQSS